MKRPIRLLAAVAGGAVVASFAVGPAFADPAGGLTINPTSGTWQFGNGNPADPITVTPQAACPAGSAHYVDTFYPTGTDPTLGGFLTPMADLGGNLQVPAQEGSWQDGGIENILDAILPAGTTDTVLSPADAAKPVGTVIAEDDFAIAGLCLDSDLGVLAQFDSAAVHVSVATREATPPSDFPSDRVWQVTQWSWQVSGGGQPGGPATTTTTLTASPSGGASQGSPVTLTAHVDQASAAGHIEFLDGTDVLSSQPVTAGAASITTKNLSVGSHTLKATFVPDDTTAFAGSSGTLNYTISEGNGGTPNQSGKVTLQTTVSQPTETGALTLTVDPTAPVNLPTPTRDGDDLVTSVSNVDLATVTDTRSIDKPGWTVNGAVSDTFVGNDATHTFSGKALGWTPKVTSQDNGQGASAGAAVAAGSDPGLTGVGATLASAGAGDGLGTAKLSADLSLKFPATTPADTYHADVTITAI
ncbi:Ig-like domain-containing protein [Rugosimonospora africana]|uniref:Bacterial Ig-like domain-containing protein n=1 Tax=Rugosimonospora africana TaxID=556532 RepID=A0A8J3VW28_9ACTN|nr:Ig-like domain-containing protein [Rugosimonospora africana]GIH20381.1 hypothetical protein Raf01_85530 [Rugosimonospora africana]